MSLLKLTNFGGELPRVKPRGLPDGAAQRYENLLATSASAAPSMALSRSTQSVTMPMLDTKYQRTIRRLRSLSLGGSLTRLAATP